MQATAFIQTTAHRGTENLPFFAKRKRAGERLQAVPAREKIKGRGSAPGHGRMSITERLAGQGSGHCPKPRAAVAYGPSPGYCPQQCRAYRPDKAAGTARPGLLRGGKGFTFLATYFAWPARPYTAPGFLEQVRMLSTLYGSEPGFVGERCLAGHVPETCSPASLGVYEGHSLRTLRGVGAFRKPPRFWYFCRTKVQTVPLCAAD